jgi:hypothetical protein
MAAPGDRRPIPELAAALKDLITCRSSSPWLRLLGRIRRGRIANTVRTFTHSLPHAVRWFATCVQPSSGEYAKMAFWTQISDAAGPRARPRPARSRCSRLSDLSDLLNPQPLGPVHVGRRSVPRAAPRFDALQASFAGSVLLSGAEESIALSGLVTLP